MVRVPLNELANSSPSSAKLNSLSAPSEVSESSILTPPPNFLIRDAISRSVFSNAWELRRHGDLEIAGIVKSFTLRMSTTSSCPP